jgi:hypothetical protein
MLTVIDKLKAIGLSYVKMYDVINSQIRGIIRNDTKNLAGIYCWENKLNNNAYVGRSKNLCERLMDYFTPSTVKYAAEVQRSSIAKAILKYDISNFRLFILEVVPNHNDKLSSHREHLVYLEGLWAGRLNSTYNIAPTGIGASYNPPSSQYIANQKGAQSTADRIAQARRDKRTSFIDCYEYSTNKFLFTFEGVRELARSINKVPGTIRHHLNKGTPLKGTLHGEYYVLRIVRKENGTIDKGNDV